jgi:tRNA1(Val) A37 N6-methylase TrmN6
MSVDHRSPDVKPQSETSDAFLDGRLRVLQPAGGFRAGLDSVLLGASVRAGQGTLLDLGSGAGVAGLVALSHHPGLSARFADRDPAMVALSARNIEANGFADRAEAMRADAAGDRALQPDTFDTVIANPPFFEAGAATPPAEAAAAHALPPGDLERWVATAAASARSGGEVIFIHRAGALATLAAAFAGQLGGIEIQPLAPHPGAAANRILIRGIKGSRAPLSLLTPIAIHAAPGGAFSAEIEAVLRGRRLLDWQARVRSPT